MSLKFKVHPHIVEDLGLNLYTELPRVLVEFIANAYDADSPGCDIMIDFDAIREARRIMKEVWEKEQRAWEEECRRVELAGSSGQKLSGPPPRPIPLEDRTLPTSIQIVISDKGHGMSRDELESKFLVAGRRRRKTDGVYSEGGRVVMGRKGLGKLAGFGVAHRVEVVSRRAEEPHATYILLDYQELVQHPSTDEIEVPEDTLQDGGGVDPSGTQIVLSELVYDPVKSQRETIAGQIGQHFAFIDPEDFLIRINGEPIEPPRREFAFAYPDPDKPADELVEHTFTIADGRSFSFQYRLRFTPQKQHLKARDRGIRVYAHKRLASAPDLLDAPTGMHGFRQTDYLDGVVHADFIDDQPTEYIATDRQSLRWDTPLLSPMREFLSDQIRKACEKYQRFRDIEAGRVAREDPYTKSLVQGQRLPPYKERIAYSIAGDLHNHLPGGKDSEEYKQQLQILVDGLGQGSILRAIADMAKEDTPDLNRVVARATELTERELGEFIRFIEGRLGAIGALRKICRAVDFRASKNEKQLHKLFEKSPWLIDTTFTQLMTSNQPQVALFDRLAQHLGVGEYAPKEASEDDQKRPDLVFLLGNKAQRRLIIIELKAPNTPLENDHLTQLKEYMVDARGFLETKLPGQRFAIEGYLIGSMPEEDSKARGAKLLREEIRKAGPATDWAVRDIEEVLDRAEAAHHELSAVYERVAGVETLPVLDSEAA
jgi:hypothetical protein